MWNFFLPISKFRLFAQENTAIKAEGSLIKFEFTLYKREVANNNQVFIFPGGGLTGPGSTYTEASAKIQPNFSSQKPTPATADPSNDNEAGPNRLGVLRLANHVIIDQTTALKPGMSLQLADDFYISAHMAEDAEVYFPTWDRKEGLIISFGSNVPTLAGSRYTGKRVPFIDGLAKMSDHVSLACHRINPGQTVFFEEPGFAISLSADCQMLVWDIERQHTREIHQHYFLLLTSGKTKEPR